MKEERKMLFVSAEANSTSSEGRCTFKPSTAWGMLYALLVTLWQKEPECVRLEV